jgi:hypothetical protein
MKKTTDNKCHKNPNPLFAYCADCHEQLGESTSEHQDTRVICPKNAHHLARVVKVPAGIAWLKVERWLMCWEVRYSPRCWFGSWKGLFEERAGVYLLVRLAIVLMLCVGLGLSYGTELHWVMVSLSYVIGLLFLADLLFSSSSIAFITSHPANPIRSATFTLVGLITLSSIFAVFFLGVPNDFAPCLKPISAIYFSLVTLATVGYGDIRPLDNHSLAQLMVFLELMVGAYFVLVIVAIITSWGANPKRFYDPVPVSSVLKKDDEVNKVPKK